MLMKYDNYLASSFSVDYWSDEGIGIAEEMLSDFTNEDWQQLDLMCESRDAKWLTRCCEVLGDHENSHTFNVLVKLADNADIDVKIAALDSINSLLSFTKVDESQIEDIRSVVDRTETSSIVAKAMLQSLKRKIS